MKMKTLLIAAACVVSGTVITGSAALLLPHKALDPSRQTKEERVYYIASKDFSKLSDAEKRAYLSQASNGQENGRRRMSAAELSQLSGDQRRTYFENMRPMMEAGREKMEAEREKRIKEYFALTPEQRDEYLENMVKQMQDRRSQFAARADGSGGNGGGRGFRGRNGGGSGGTAANSGGAGNGRARPGGGGGGTAAMKNRIASQDPAMRAQAMAFSNALRAKMKAHGIQQGPQR